MKGIEALIKIHTFELDEKRRALKQIQEFQNSIEDALEQLEEQVSSEASLNALCPGYGRK